MTLRQILKFEIACDGYKPNGQPCPCDITVEATSRRLAESKAASFGWMEDYRGWLCNASHRTSGEIIR